MPTIEISSTAEIESKSSSPTNHMHRAASHSSAPPSVARDNDNKSRMVSVHPLAALGFQSEAPSISTRPVITTTDDLADQESADPHYDNATEDTSSTYEQATVPGGIVPSDSVKSSDNINDADFIRSLVERSGSRFGDEFEARVRELVAQRVAEIVAERMLAAFGPGTSSIRPHTKSRARGPSDSGLDNSTGDKARRSGKRQKSPTSESQDTKRK